MSSWGAVYRGSGSVQGVAREFLVKYARHVIRRPEFQVQPLRVTEVLSAMRALGATAPGMDNWAPAELRDCPWEAATWLTAFLNRIEEGMNWPEALTKARTAYLAKERGFVDDPMSFRGLTVMAQSTGFGPNAA
eukprot:3210727-Alexandrium_andersonii.AAC.1